MASYDLSIMSAGLFEASDAECLTAFAGLAHAAAREANKSEKTEIVDQLRNLAIARGMEELYGEDAIQAQIARAFDDSGINDRVPDDWAEPQHAPTNGKAKLHLLNKAEFVATFRPPNYLIDGMLQRRFIYALTGQTGHAKTAIALLIAELVARKRIEGFEGFLAGHKVEPGRVVYLVGENPDDVSMRVIGADSLRYDDANLDDVYFLPSVVNINEVYDAIAEEVEAIDGCDLVIVDTSAAYFFGEEEQSNTQMNAHARMLRRLTKLAGGPCVLVLCHPIKHVDNAAQLLPRGGGAFLAEMDGNLTAWKHDDVLIELHHGKMRGPGFEPMSFRLESISNAPTLRDAKGRQLSTVQAKPATQSEEDKLEGGKRAEEDLVLVKLLADPDSSLAEIAIQCGWLNAKTGEGAKWRVRRVFERLEHEKRPLTRNNRGKWELTDYGKEQARRLALGV